MLGEGTKTSETKSDKFEVQIRDNLEKFLQSKGEPFSNLEVSRYEGSDTKFYSDIRVTNPENEKNIWMEVKLNKYANLGGPSFKYKEGKWTCTTTKEEEDHLTKIYLEALERGSERFISFCKEYLKTEDINIPKDLSPELIEAWKKSGSVEDTENDVQFITDKVPLEGFGEKIAEYYKTAKYEPVYYIQVDDELYIVDPKYNPLGLKTRDGHELKTLSEAYRIGRIQFRAKGIDKKLKDGGKYYYSIVCDVKILADDQKEDEPEYICSFKSEEKFPMTDNERENIQESRKFVHKSLKILMEEWIPDYDDKPVNQWGEKWMNIPSTDWIFVAVNDIVKDCQADPDEEHKEDSLRLSSVHRTEYDNYIVTVFGGCNGGGTERKLVTYLAVVKKLVKKLLERFGSVWLIDWDNDCLDDVWTVRLAFRNVNDKAENDEIKEIYDKLMGLYGDEDVQNVDGSDVGETPDGQIVPEADSDIGGEKSDEIPEDGIKIWIDDIREAPKGFKWFKSVNDFIDWCHERNDFLDVTLIDTDHDAGDYQSQGGDYVRCFDYLDFCGCENVTVHIHSANPVGANNIRRIISRNKERGWKEIRNS